MPVKSAKQFRFMKAAAKGMKGLGISKELARDFIEKTPKKKRQEYARKGK